MKQSFKTSKLYYGFPIFILGYQDQNFGHNITTCSSSYSLGDWLVIGVGAEENAAEQIKHYQKFTVNIPDENLMLEMEQAGFISHREKLKHLGLDYEISKRTQAPILEACPVVLDCQVDRIIEEDGICHIFAKIIERLADSELLDDKGHFKNDRFAPTYFMGDGHQRVYRYLDNRVDPMGSFIKKARKKDVKSELPERLETERLVLRVRTVEDAEDIYTYASLPEVAYPAGFPPVKTLEDEIYYLEHILPERNQKEKLPAGYGIVVKGTDKVIGSVDFNHRHADDVLEIGYTLHPDYWGRGYVPEAALALIDLAFRELGLHKIELTCFGYNLQSQRIAEKLGFTLEARIRERKDIQGNRCDSLIYGLLKSEWEVI